MLDIFNFFLYFVHKLIRIKFSCFIFMYREYSSNFSNIFVLFYAFPFKTYLLFLKNKMLCILFYFRQLQNYRKSQLF
ncbi:hypothetical protein H740_06567 [Campylobacter showae CC57C]|uniref:Uncharacterized protein n=1 Tax=Campylobacter showae CC57C TaxID=1073353 RepID=M3GYA3_9BACT|nr:hypothetical protein H740_06567 [Campylobacter showae CC57C]